MNEGLFSKYIKVLHEKRTHKEVVLKILQDITSIPFVDEEIEINKKTIIFNISSVKKNSIIKKNIKNKLEEKGYSVKL